MELHYLWINSFLPFEKQGINLSARFIIKVEYFEKETGESFTEQDMHFEFPPKRIMKSRREVRISIAHNPKYIENFFDKPNLTNVTGIIGKNGAGKSRILNYIKSNFPEGIVPSNQSDIILYSENDKKTENFYIVLPDDWVVNVDDKTQRFKKTGYNTKASPNSIGEAFRSAANLAQIDFIYYSFFLDFKPEYNQSGVLDISTSAILEKVWIRNFEDSFGLTPDKQPVSNSSSYVTNFVVEETGYAVQFLTSDSADLLPFDKPDTLQITIVPEDRRFFINNSSRPDVSDVINRLEENYEKPRSIKYRALDNLFIAIFLNQLRTEMIDFSSMEISYEFLYNPEDSIESFVLTFFEGLRKKAIVESASSALSQKYIKLSSDIPKLIDKLKQLFDQEYLTLPLNDSTAVNFVFHLKKGSDKAFKDMINLYLTTKGSTPYLSFSWRTLSTGEQSFLSFVSRFHHVKYHEPKRPLKKENLFIMIDEGDAGYHPEWQRDFLKKTLDFLCQIFSDKRIQLVYTANTPFLASDLPKSNVIFLEKQKNGAVIIHDKDNDREETFGSNIHTLYADSFYMDGVLMGAIAKNKINEIIQFLNDKEIKQPNERIKKTIEIIGEPIIRTKLQMLWNEKFGVREEIDYLQNKINELKAKHNL